MNALKYLTIGVIALNIAACSKSSSKSTAPSEPAIAAKYQGIWQASGYGDAMKVSENKVSFYKYSTDYCFLENSADDVETSDIEQGYKLLDGTSLEEVTGNGTMSFSAPGVVFSKVSTLPSSCVSNLTSQKGEANYSKDYELDLAVFHQFFKEYYFDFETKSVDIDVLYQETSQKILAGTNEFELAEIMMSMVEPLKDGHVEIAINDDAVLRAFNKPLLTEVFVKEYAELNNLPFPIPAEQVDLNELSSYIVSMIELQWELVTDYAPSESAIKTAAGGLIRWFENEGIGYLYIGAMTGYAEETDDLSDVEVAQKALDNLDATLEQALSDLSQTQGLILDIRTNGGGQDFISLAIASRFAASDNIHVYSKQARDGDARTALVDVHVSPRGNTKYLSPVVLLTSNNTVSGAEVFTMAMKQFSNVTIVGEATQGSFSDVLNFPLPNGFEIGLSNEFYLTPQGDWYEHVGVPVDIEVPFFTIEQREEGVDLGIETAFDVLSQ